MVRSLPPTWLGSSVFGSSWVFFSSWKYWSRLFNGEPERSYRWPTNFGFGLVNAGLLAIAPLSTISAAVWANQTGVGLLNQVAIPLWVSMGCTLVVYSLTNYLIHLMEHKTPWLWRIHRVHHLDTHLDVSTSQRHHPLELMVNVLILVAVTIVFGLTSSF